MTEDQLRRVQEEAITRITGETGLLSMLRRPSLLSEANSTQESQRVSIEAPVSERQQSGGSESKQVGARRERHGGGGDGGWMGWAGLGGGGVVVAVVVVTAAAAAAELTTAVHKIRTD
ncbi:MAG: hypothetical protein SGPRY_003720 [Prymnesium sp.]